MSARAVSCPVLGVETHPLSLEDAGRQILEWAEAQPSVRRSRVVCEANVHMIMEAQRAATFRRVLDEADLILAGGRPIWWVCRAKGDRQAAHVRGLDIMVHVCRLAADRGVPVGLFGGSQSVMEALQHVLQRGLPTLAVGYAFSPPFRSPTATEDAHVVDELKASGVRILFVGLGCPKQELWMAAHRDRLDMVMIGVGAAFDWLAGAQPVAPRWMQLCGLEWLYRLHLEPRRLLPRYVRYNIPFALRALKDILLGDRRGR